MAEMQARKRDEDRKRATEIEIEKRRAHEEHQRQVQKFFADHQMELRRKLESMQGAEKKKQQALMERNRLLQEENALKRSRAEERLRKNFEMAKMVEEKRKNDFLEAQAKFEESRSRHLANLERERQLHTQEVVIVVNYKLCIFITFFSPDRHLVSDYAPRATASYAARPVSARRREAKRKHAPEL
jgi:hypothetical protein